MTKKIKIVLLLVLLLSPLCAQKQFSTQPHTGPVTSLVQKNEFVFSSGEDGFITRWDQNGLGEHLQVSDIAIKKIDVSPDGRLIAVYESDDFSIHRISVWDWKTKTRKYAKRFSDTVLSVSFSHNGTYLMVGLSTADGLVFLDAEYGITMQLIKDQISVVSLCETSKTESTAVLYSTTGSLVYANLQTGSTIQKFNTESGLSKTAFADTNKNYFTGIKNGKIYIIYATTGKTLASFAAKSPLLITGVTNTHFSYIEEVSKGTYAVKQVSLEKGELQFKPLVTSMFTIPSLPSVISALSSQLIIGAKDGAIYTAAFTIQTETNEAVKVTESLYDRILDVEVVNSNFYLLTKDTVYRANINTSAEIVFPNEGYTNCTAYDASLILWSKGHKKPVKMLNTITGDSKELFNPKIGIETLRVFDNALVCVLGSTTVLLFNFITNKETTIYTGTGLQDAVLYTDDIMFVSKTAATSPKTPLIEINTKTKETVMLPVSGDVIFSLVVNRDTAQPVIYGVSASTSLNSKRTEIFSYNPERKSYSAILKWEDEDTQAFTSVINTILYTNIGKTNIRNLNISTRKSITLERSASLPVKIKGSNNQLLVLNKDGSVSWYYETSEKKISDWCITTDGHWLEF
jgi:WD40 repeat protein